MKTISSVLCLLLGVMIGPLAILTFMPIGSSYQLQPILGFGAAAFASGAVAVALVIIGATMAGETIKQVEEKLDADQPKQ